MNFTSHDIGLEDESNSARMAGIQLLIYYRLNFLEE
jgi:hypothetical protein